MSFKVHLIIICAIIVMIYVAMQIIGKQEAPAPVAAPKASKYKISVISASWGLNCLDYDYWGDDTPKRDVFANSPENNKPQENNILSRVQALCEGKKSCKFKAEEETLGPQPVKNCRDAEIQIEYRCFSFDRPWNIQTMDKDIEIDCEAQNP